MPAANAIQANRKKAKPLVMCPRCRSSRATEVEKNRHLCETCGGVFEAVEHGFVDDRPEQNAMKKERAR